MSPYFINELFQNQVAKYTYILSAQYMYKYSARQKPIKLAYVLDSSVSKFWSVPVLSYSI